MTRPGQAIQSSRQVEEARLLILYAMRSLGGFAVQWQLGSVESKRLAMAGWLGSSYFPAHTHTLVATALLDWTDFLSSAGPLPPVPLEFCSPFFSLLVLLKLNQPACARAANTKQAARQNQEKAARELDHTRNDLLPLTDTGAFRLTHRSRNGTDNLRIAALRGACFAARQAPARPFFEGPPLLTCPA